MAVTTIDGKPCDVLDAHGRLVVTPHAITLDGQTNVPADLRPGESLAEFLGRHVPGIGSGWSVTISGYTVPQNLWGRTYPHHGQLIACRAVVGKSVLRLIATAVLAYFTLGFGTVTAGMWGAGAVAGAWGGLAAIGVYVAGSMLINKVLGPKVPKVQSDAAKQVYSLSSQRNSMRPYEPLPVLWGEVRVTPDLASQPYTWFDGDDQYLSTILLGGINVYSASDLSIGDTPIGSYDVVDLFYNGFPGMPSAAVPLYSNADSIAGGEFDNGGDWITRTSSTDTIVLQIDIEGQLYATGDGGVTSNSAVLTIETRPVGGSWAPAATTTLTSSSTSPIRRTLSFSVASGQYEVRAKLGTPTHNEGNGKDACQIAWTVLKSIQADSTDYSGWGRIGIKIKATGQLNGGLDTLRATYRAKPIPLWDGTSWANVSTRETGLSNPGAIILQTLRGVYDPNGVLQFGFGMDDAQIDMEGIKAFMLHCTAKGYTYDRWITDTVSLGDFCQEVALAGMGEFSWTDGSRPTVVFVDSAQPISAVANMANIVKASFSVDYTLSNAADGIEYQYVDRAKNWETQTLRVTAPGVATMLNPARITGDGVTTAAHAAIMARYHLAQSLYQYKTIGYTADIEHLDYRRLSVLSLSHDLTQWGYGGRLVSADVVAGKVVLTLDEPVPPLPTPYVGLRLPGERDYRVWPVEALVSESNTLTLIGDWPTGVDMPGEGLDNPAHDTLWCYDFKATPGYRVRVVSMEPEEDLKGARISCVPEGPEFWDYVLNGTYTPAPSGTVLPQLATPTVSNLRVTENVHLQGDTEWYELTCVWNVAGAFDHAQVWAARDGAELQMVDANAQARSTFRINGGGNWLIQVKPFDASGRAGATTSLLYITDQVGLAPWNPNTFVVQVLGNGLRRYAWSYTSDSPATLAGMQIRYRSGSTPATVSDWDTMTPLGVASDIYTAQFELTRPDAAGDYTFALRAINTAGQLATGVKSYSVTLSDPFADFQAPDLTPPPVPTGLDAIAGITAIMVEWATPTYTVGHGHAQTQIWASTTDDIATASKVAEGFGGPVSFLEDTDTKVYIWARNVSVDGVAGSFTSSINVTTGQVGSDDIGTGVVQNGHIANLSAAKLTVGDGTIGGPLKSSNFVTGSTGWRLLPDGTAEFSGVTVRGSIYSTQGTIGGITINANGLNAGSFESYAWPVSGGGFHLSSSGLLLGNYNTGQYFQVSAAGAVSAPGLSIASGSASFSGSVTASSGYIGSAVIGATSVYSSNYNAATGVGWKLNSDGTVFFPDASIKNANIDALTITAQKISIDAISGSARTTAASVFADKSTTTTLASLTFNLLSASRAVLFANVKSSTSSSSGTSGNSFAVSLRANGTAISTKTVLPFATDMSGTFYYDYRDGASLGGGGVPLTYTAASDASTVFDLVAYRTGANDLSPTFQNIELLVLVLRR